MSFGFGFGFPKNYGAAAFDPRTLFGNGEQGAWYDPSDLTTLYQDSAGTTPVTAVEQPVGLMLDKSKGLVLGPELVTNGDFSNGSTGWVVGAGWSVSGGAANASASSAMLSQNSIFTSGKWYKLTFQQTFSTGSLQLRIAGAQNIGYFNNSGVITAYVYATVSGALEFNGTSLTTVIDNISVRELPGNHAFQATSANRPVLSARVNLLTKTQEFDDAVWLKTASSISANSATAPDGTTTADKIVENTANSTHEIRQDVVTVAGAYVFSAYVKAAGRTFAMLYHGQSNAAQVVDLSTGAASGNAGLGVPTAFSITDAGSGWYRVSMTVTATAATNNFRVYPLSNSTTYGYTGDGTSGILVWGADLRPTNTGANLPAYQRVNTSTDYDTVGFPLYLKANGTNSAMQTNSVDFTGTDKVTVWAGVRSLSNSLYQEVIELSTAFTANNGGFAVYKNGSNINQWYAASSGSTYSVAEAYGYPPPITNVVTGIGNISGDQVILRINGTQAASSTADQGTGNYGNYPLFLFARNASSLFFNGQFYGAIIRGAQSTDAQISSAEQWMNGKTLAYEGTPGTVSLDMNFVDNTYYSRVI